MFSIQGKIISLDVIEKHFVCDLDACKGACCIEGVSGAPLNPEEAEWLEQNINLIKPYMDEEGRSVADQTKAVYNEEFGLTTALKKDGACIYAHRNSNHILECAIEQAWAHGETDFIKPISCHLYPIRIKKSDSFEALNYDRWDICGAACRQGEALGVPVYQFLKNALVRKYGEEFYNELDEVAKAWKER